MKYYMIEYTAWTTGREFGHPYRTYKVTNDKVRALTFMKERMTEKRNYQGYDEPKYFELEGEQVDTLEAIKELDNFERQKDVGSYI